MQKNTKASAAKCGYVTTILGRRRHLPDCQIQGKSPAKGHAERAAINTPIQGGAADIAMLAMLQLTQCPELKELGYTLLLQVHDEVILEGPEEHAERAQELVQFHMMNPFPKRGGTFGTNPLTVDLNVDGSYAKTWYEAK